MRLIVDQNPHFIDPSELLRPEPAFADKCLTKFRDYSIDEEDPVKKRVRDTYRQMHLNQTVDFVLGRHDSIIFLELIVKFSQKLLHFIVKVTFTFI